MLNTDITPLQIPSTSKYPVPVPILNIQQDLDILLLELPQRYMPFIPIGLGYVDEILTRMGVRHQTLDFNVMLYHQFHSRRIAYGLHDITSSSGYKLPDDPWATLSYDEWTRSDIVDYFAPQLTGLANAIVTARPKILALSLSETNREASRRVINAVRNLCPGIIILVGGYDCAYPEVVQNISIDYDYAVIGEAEGVLPGLLNNILSGGKPSDLPGILSRYDSPNREWERGQLVQNLDSVQYPRYSWPSLEYYQTYEGVKTMTVLSSRGCIWARCRFCADSFPFRKRSPENTVDELEWFARHGYKNFSFSDLDPLGDHMPDICREINRRGLKITFYFQARIQKQGTPEFYRTLKSAGCIQASFGVDAWSDQVSRLQNKGYNMEMVKTNLHNCHEAGIWVRTNMVIGVPGETENDISDCIANIISMKDDIDCHQSLNTLSFIIGSAYWREPEKYGIRFQGGKEEVYKKYHYYVPSGLWYSVDPYIDEAIRVKRRDRIYQELKAAGVKIGGSAELQVQGTLRKSFPFKD
jgi:radical SAM superfamily enzyme YgiQ (UPF0313 family)